MSEGWENRKEAGEGIQVEPWGTQHLVGFARPLGSPSMLPCEQKSSRASGMPQVPAAGRLTHLSTQPPPHDLGGIAAQEDLASPFKCQPCTDNLLLHRVEWEVGE